MNRDYKVAYQNKAKRRNDKHCEGCHYYKMVFPPERCCHYLLMTNQKRPCDPGKDCTVKVIVKKQFSKKEKK